MIKTKTIEAKLTIQVCDCCNYFNKLNIEFGSNTPFSEEFFRQNIDLSEQATDYRTFWRNPISLKDYCNKCFENNKHFEGKDPNIKNSVELDFFQIFNCGLIENINGKCSRCYGTGKIIVKNSYRNLTRIHPNYPKRGTFRALLSSSKQKCLTLISHHGFWMPYIYEPYKNEPYKEIKHATYILDVLFIKNENSKFPYVRVPTQSNLIDLKNVESEYGKDITERFVNETMIMEVTLDYPDWLKIIEENDFKQYNGQINGK